MQETVSQYQPTKVFNYLLHEALCTFPSQIRKKKSEHPIPESIHVVVQKNRVFPSIYTGVLIWINFHVCNGFQNGVIHTRSFITKHSRHIIFQHKHSTNIGKSHSIRSFFMNYWQLIRSTLTH